MKHGIILNTLVILFLLALVLMPLLVFFAADQIGKANGCNLSVPNSDGLCGSLYSSAFLAGLFGSVTSPLLALVLLLYTTGTLVLYAIHGYLRRKQAKARSKFVSGMALSSAAGIGLTVIGIVLVAGVNWYQVSFVSTCKGLPQNSIQSVEENGPLAVSVKLPEPKDSFAQYRLWALNAEGKLIRTLSNAPGASTPAWSDDGSQLAFITRSDDGKKWNIVRMDLQKNLTDILLESGQETRNPAWSSDGSTLLFEGWNDQVNPPNQDVFSLKLSDNAAQLLTESPAFDGDPKFSPDGSRILFVSQRDGSSDIYVMDRDGSNINRLTRHSSNDIDPEWSPDGQWIVFSSNRNSPSTRNNYNLFIMSPNGTNQCQLTTADGSEWEPAWSPDGQWIAYISLLDQKLYKIRPNGSENTPILLENEVSDILDMDWAPAQ